MKPIGKDLKLHIFFLIGLAGIFIWSLIGCFDLFTWTLEAFPVILGGAILIVVYRRFRFTNLVYLLIWFHAIILLIGAHYTYARMPLFNWIRDTFELSRNHYDRLGHFAQGFVPAIIAREVFWRKSPLKGSRWLGFIVVSFCLAFSALFEMFEWLVAVIAKEDATSYLATQGDVWDTQWDMFFCLIGSIVSLLILSRLHDKALKKVVSPV